MNAESGPCDGLLRVSTGSGRSTSGLPGLRRTGGRKRHRTRTCRPGGTSPRPTVSSAPTPASARAPSASQNATVKSPTLPASAPFVLCLSVGYAAMSRRITSAGGFYPYVARGLGGPPAVAAALVAVIAYDAVAVELVAGLGYFGQLVVQQQTGVNLPWELYAAFGVAAAALLGYRT